MGDETELKDEPTALSQFGRTIDIKNEMSPDIPEDVLYHTETPTLPMKQEDDLAAQ